MDGSLGNSSLSTTKSTEGVASACSACGSSPDLGISGVSTGASFSLSSEAGAPAARTVIRSVLVFAVNLTARVFDIFARPNVAGALLGTEPPKAFTEGIITAVCM
eukprot:CAMPEP_0118929972 /NCGR_PEP_ID=MMETSP1169-20130426/6819_1 /TAXON_ID=36882 /ORGANISM="Pyramimonas obovata, Strain CCMP722" /LENGTH=104 /DNA_ID=CAMNT_0006872259 /DNA_START=420 /DNA_END=734 /DNA_ORIENTATION=+